MGIGSSNSSPDGEKVIIISSDTTGKIWDVSSGRLLSNLKGHKSLIFSSEFSPDGKKIATASIDGTAKIWDVLSGKLLLDLKENNREVGRHNLI